MSELEAVLPSAAVRPVAVPRDCTDGFGISHRGRPEATLDPAIRRASSNWHELPPAATERGLRRLRRDLETGDRDRRYGHLRSQENLDVGLRLLVAELA